MNKQQAEIQSAYFGQDSFSIFAACFYLRDADGKLIIENVTVISEASDHLRIAAFSCVNKVFSFVRESYPPWLRWAISIQVCLLFTINNG